METGIRLGRIAGIRIDANWSVLVVFWLISWALATVTLPDRSPGETTAVYWLGGIVGALIFFASLLVHELAHAIVARSRDVAVEGITLWLFGGVSKLGDEPDSAGDELRIAVAGPATSLGSAGLFYLLAWGLSGPGAPEVAVETLGWLGLVNLLLGLFNLLPGAPLDGGRVLRALVWRCTGDRLEGTRAAARMGRGLAYGLIGLGLVGVAMGGLVTGLWFIFLGWFLLSAARGEESSSLLRAALADVRVRDVMTPDPTVAPADASVGEVIESYVMRYRFSGFPLVGADGEIRGLVSLAQLKRVPHEARHATPVVGVATSLDDVPKARPEEGLYDLIMRLSQAESPRALVFEDGRMVGIVTATDVTRAIDIANLVAS